MIPITQGKRYYKMYQPLFENKKKKGRRLYSGVGISPLLLSSRHFYQSPAHVYRTHTLFCRYSGHANKAPKECNLEDRHEKQTAAAASRPTGKDLRPACPCGSCIVAAAEFRAVNPDLERERAEVTRRVDLARAVGLLLVVWYQTQRVIQQREGASCTLLICLTPGKIYLAVYSCCSAYNLSESGSPSHFPAQCTL